MSILTILEIPPLLLAHIARFQSSIKTAIRARIREIQTVDIRGKRNQNALYITSTSLVNVRILKITLLKESLFVVDKSHAERKIHPAVDADRGPRDIACRW